MGKNCNKCFRHLDYTNFHKNLKFEDNLQRTCKDCISEYQRSNREYKNQEIVSLEGEIWKDIIGYEGIYMVSNYSRVKTLSKIFDTKNGTKRRITRESEVFTRLQYGYCAGSLRKNNVTKPFYLHRVVAQAFIENPENKPHINHIDCDRANNNLSNLEWVTPQENATHASLNDRLPKGKKHHKARSVEKLDMKGNFIFKYDTLAEAAKKNCIFSANIVRCCKQDINHSGGFKWRYAS